MRNCALFDDLRYRVVSYVDLFMFCLLVCLFVCMQAETGDPDVYDYEYI